MNTAKIVLGIVMLLLSFSFAAPLSAGYVSSCGEITAPGIYELNADISTATTPTTTGACILITADNVVFNGNDHTVSAPGMGEYAISVAGSSEVMVESTVLTNSYVGINVIDSSNVILEGNTARYNSWGYELVSSSGCTLMSNIAMQNSQAGFAVNLDSDGNVLESNTASGNGEGIRLSQSYSDSPDRNRVLGNTVNENDEYGIFVYGTDSTLVSGNSVGLNGYEGMTIVNSQNTEIEGNTLTGNSRSGGNGQVNLRYAENYNFHDNVLSGPGEGITIDTYAYGLVEGNTIRDCDYAITVMSEGNRFTDNLVENCDIAFYSWDYYNGNVVDRLTLKQGTPNVVLSFTYQHGDGNGVKISFVPETSSEPSGYSSVEKKYFYVEPLNGTVGIDMYVHWNDAEVSRFYEDSIRLFRLGSSGWEQYSDLPDTSANHILFKYMETPGIVGVFANPRPTPPTPPVTPPSGGGSSGGTTHGGGGSGAPHVGIPYVPSGSSGGTTVSVEPSCTSDSDCASSAECSGGICVALEAGGSCGAFVDHEWVDYGCCGTEDCAPGEVCRDNECVSMEPLDFAGTEPQGSGSESSGSDQGLGRLLADIPWWVLLILVLMVGGGIYARYRMGQSGGAEGESSDEMPPAEPEEE